MSQHEKQDPSKVRKTPSAFIRHVCLFSYACVFCVCIEPCAFVHPALSPQPTCANTVPSELSCPEGRGAKGERSTLALSRLRGGGRPASILAANCTHTHTHIRCMCSHTIVLQVAHASFAVTHTHTCTCVYSPRVESLQVTWPPHWLILLPDGAVLTTQCPTACETPANTHTHTRTHTHTHTHWCNLQAVYSCIRGTCSPCGFACSACLLVVCVCVCVRVCVCACVSHLQVECNGCVVV